MAAYERLGNKFFKRGWIPNNPKKKAEGSYEGLTARFEVGPGGAQVSLEDLEKAIGGGGQIVKRHFDGKRSRARIDVLVPICGDERGFTIKELKEIHKTMSKDFAAAAEAAQAAAPADRSEVAELSKLVADQQKQMKAMMAQMKAMAPEKEKTPVE